MSFRRNVLANLVVQAAGPACAFLTVLVVARTGGPLEQGRFAQAKAWVDLLVALGLFGFPQAFVYVVHARGGNAGVLARWSRLYAAGYLAVALAVTAAAGALGAGYLPAETGRGAWLALAGAAAGLVLHGLWRGLVLTRTLGPGFAVFTVLPAAALLAAMVGAALAGWRRFDLVLLLSAALTLVPAWVMTRPILREPPAGSWRDQPWRALLSNGLHAFLQALLQTAQPLAAYWLVSRAGAGAREVGLLHAGLFLVQGLAIPVTMTAPLLFARWTAAQDERLLQRLHRLTWPALAVGAGLGLGLAVLARPVVGLVFGAGYEAGVLPAQILLATLPLYCHVRALAPALHARGRPQVNTAAAALRLGGLVAFGLAAAGADASAQGIAAVAVALGEGAAAAWTLVSLRLLAAAEPAEGGRGAAGP